jgi:hypothetical protein
MFQAWLPAPFILDVNYSFCHKSNVIEPPAYNSISHLLIKNYSYIFLHANNIDNQLDATITVY